jgi:hypothetical protein
MASDRDVEKAEETDSGNSRESTVHQSDVEKAEPNLVKEGAVGEPDSDHEEIEGLDEGHLDDLVRQHVSLSVFVGSFANST